MKLQIIKYQSKFIWGVIGLLTCSGLVIGLGVVHKEKPSEQTKVAEELQASPVQPITEVTKIKMHTVQDGETLSGIAERYGIDVDTLQGANENLSEDIHYGDQLVILPSKGLLHIVDMGDTLWQMANVYGVDMNTIMNANGKENEDLLIGEKIFVPGAKKVQQTQRQLARADEQVSRSNNERFIWPATGDVSSPFGYRWGRLHAGIDLANDTGTTIRAARSGRVSHTGWYSGYGRTVIIEHDQGYVTLYGHLNDFVVQTNQYVKGGQVIAHMGSTGNSTGPHLHFEVQKNGTPINPYNILP